jgi:hypothetical protein
MERLDYLAAPLSLHYLAVSARVSRCADVVGEVLSHLSRGYWSVGAPQVMPACSRVCRWCRRSSRRIHSAAMSF